MKQIFDVYAFFNVLGCVTGIFLILKAFVKEDLEKTQPEWNSMAFICVAGCVLGIYKEVYSLINHSDELISAWPFKSVTSCIVLISIAFYRLSIKTDQLYKEKV